MKILLLTLDNLAPARLGCYGYSNNNTKNIDYLANNGVRFNNVFTAATSSAPGHWSILCSKYPIQHGLRENFWKIKDNIHSLVTNFNNNEFTTIGIPSVETLSSYYNFNKGFSKYYNNSKSDRVMQKLAKIKIGKYNLLRFLREKFKLFPHSRDGKKTTEILLKEINDNKNKNFFIWVHYFDIHSARGDYYDGAVSRINSFVGKVIEKLKDLQIFEDTLIVITSDHGENLTDKSARNKNHGWTVYDYEIKVPLIIYYPKKLRPMVIPKLTRTIDVMPTILALSGIVIPEDVEGRSLLPLIERNEDVAEFAISEAYPPFIDSKCIRTDKYKLIITNNKNEELYDIKLDSDESKNLVDIEKEVALSLKQKLQSYYLGIPYERQETQEHVKQSLRDLGYID